MINPVVIGLIVQLAPLGIDAVTSIIAAFTREDLDNLTAEQAAEIVGQHTDRITTAAERRKAELDRLAAQNPT